MRLLLHKINSFLFSLFWYLNLIIERKVKWLKPNAKQIQKIKITKLALKEGDHYKLGECTVTLAKFGIEGKQEVARKIEAANKRRSERQEMLTQKGTDLMLLSPDELLKFKIDEWLKARKAVNEKLIYDSLDCNAQKEIEETLKTYVNS
jgi:hypothetical protein